MNNSSSSETELSRRIRALRRLQTEAAEIDAKFSLEVLKLEAKYDCKIAPFLERRRQIIAGEYEPRDEESDISLTYIDLPSREDIDESVMENIKGIPGFWFTVLNNIPILWSLIQRQDCDPLTFLTDISCIKNINPEPGFTLQFHFAPNQYFSNEILTKQYKLAFGKKKSDPFNFYGPEMVDCIGCEIYWKSQDLTVTIKKKKLIKRPSFFNFFDPPRSTDDPELEPHVLNYLLTDFQLAYYLKERVVPKGILYYLGEAVLRENFGFEEEVIQGQKGPNLPEDWPTTYGRKSLLNRQYEQDYKEWQKSEKLLAYRLTKQKFEKAEDYEESRTKINNLVGTCAEKNSSKGVKTKISEKEIKDILYGRNNLCQQEIIEVLNEEKKKIKNKTEKTDNKKKAKPETGNKPTVKKKNQPEKGKRYKPGTETTDSDIDPSEMDVNFQRLLEKFYKMGAKKKRPDKRNEPETETNDSDIDPSEMDVNVQRLLEKFYKMKGKKKRPGKRNEPGTETIDSDIDPNEMDVNVQRLLEMFYKVGAKKKRPSKRNEPVAETAESDIDPSEMDVNVQRLLEKFYKMKGKKKRPGKRNVPEAETIDSDIDPSEMDVNVQRLLEKSYKMGAKKKRPGKRNEPEAESIDSDIDPSELDVNVQRLLEKSYKMGAKKKRPDKRNEPETPTSDCTVDASEDVDLQTLLETYYEERTT